MPYSPFESVEHWVFDLDNTLYPAHTSLFHQIDLKISEYIQKLTGMAHHEARALQKHYYSEFGTSLNGLVREHNIEPQHFLDFVHDIDHSELKRDEKLINALSRLPGSCYILTNGTRKHAQSITEKMGISHAFSDVFDIVDADLIPKPEKSTYDKFLAHTKVTAESAVMFEDLSRNLKVPDALGMRTVLVVPHKSSLGERGNWLGTSDQEEHVHFVTDNLPDFLQSVAGFLETSAEAAD